MSSLLTLDRVSAATPDGTPLFSDLTLSIGHEIVGLVGRNGSGKSTLLSILNGERDPHAGSITRSARIVMLRQIQPEEESVADALGIAADLARLRRLEAGQGSVEDAMCADWELEARIARTFERLGLSGTGLDRPVASLSGGERTRLGLAAAILSAPDLLLLDEPTNNLDSDGRQAVADLLGGWDGGALVASHERDLLEKMDRIVHLSPIGTIAFGGGWSAFAAARDAIRQRAAGALERAERDLKQQAASVQRQVERKARRDRKGRTRRAKGGDPKIVLDAQAERAERTAARDRQLAERLIGDARETVERARWQVEIVTPLRITLPSAGVPANRVLLRFEDVTLEVQGRRLFGPLSFTVTGPERLVVSGPNGAGKTSLLRLAAGIVPPGAGTVTRAKGRFAMLDQHASLLDPKLDLVANMRKRYPAMTQGEAHACLARFAFRNQDARRRAFTLSGGEKLRAALAVVSVGRPAPRMLILDEPTNHLDIDAVEMLEQALAAWDGALLLVSHDRRFLENVGYDREMLLPGAEVRL